MAETIIITLNHIDGLFNLPDADPWNPNARYRSGIDEVWAKLRSIPIQEQAGLTIRLPPEALAEGLEARVRQAIDRYCAAHIEANLDEIGAIKKEGRRDFILSVVSALALLSIVALVVTVFRLEGALLTALVAWAGIASWAILWGPVETFIWGRVPLRRQIRYYRKLQAMEVAVRGL
jgi:hypothetical protein